MTRTQVAIVGAGPAGLFLAHLLHRAGIDSILLEAKSRSYVEARLRAGVLEHQSVTALAKAGLAERLQREGLRHAGLAIRADGRTQRIDLAALTGGKGVLVYGQHELVKDMIAARIATGRPLHFEATDVAVDVGARPTVRWRDRRGEHELACDFIAGCDGQHGICRQAIPALALEEHVYPFAWLGLLVEAPPVSPELIYVSHARGFALLSMRSPSLSRLYLQVDGEDRAGQWGSARLWEELAARLAGVDGLAPNRGPIVRKSITRLRSQRAGTLRHGRLLLAGDAAHLVPPTGAKGMNLALADVQLLAEALVQHYAGSDAELDAYSRRCLERVVQVQGFSRWMTELLHRGDDEAAREAALARFLDDAEALRRFALNYVGLPLD